MKKPRITDPDNPPLDQATLARMRPAAEVVPQLVKAARRGRGPGKKPSKELISMRLDPDVLRHFRAKGDGWQVRINDALRKAAKLPNSAGATKRSGAGR